MPLLILKYWRVALAIAIVGLLALHLWSDNRVKAQRDDYKAQLTAIEVLAEHQKKDYEANLDYAKKKQAENDKIFKAQIATLKLDRTKLTDDLRRLYENRKPKPALVPVTGGVLQQVASAESTTDTASLAEGSAGSESVPHAAFARLETQYQTLEDACALTTIYFNQARERINQDCIQIGCEQSTNP